MKQSLGARIHFRIKAPLRRKLQALARAAGVTEAELCRTILARKVRMNDEPLRLLNQP